MDQTPIPVIASAAKINQCVNRAAENLNKNLSIAILGKSNSISQAVTIAELVKRKCEVSQETKIYKKQFGAKSESCIEIILSPVEGEDYAQLITA